MSDSSTITTTYALCFSFYITTLFIFIGYFEYKAIFDENKITWIIALGFIIFSFTICIAITGQSMFNGLDGDGLDATTEVGGESE